MKILASVYLLLVKKLFCKGHSKCPDMFVQDLIRRPEVSC